MRDEFTLRGVKYVSHESLVFGDYGGAGDVGRANIEALKEQFPQYAEGAYRSYGSEMEAPEDVDGEPEMIILFGGYSTEVAFLREDVSGEIIESLENYPLLDEEKHSEIEMQWEDEALDSYARRDLLGELDDDLREQFDALPDEMQTSLFSEVYRDAMEATNSYPTMEHSGAYIPIDRISAKFCELMSGRIERFAKYGDESEQPRLPL